MFLFADGQTTERTVVPADGLGRAPGVPMRVLPDRGELIVEIESSLVTDRSHDVTWRGREQGPRAIKTVVDRLCEGTLRGEEARPALLLAGNLPPCPHYGGLRCSPEPVVGGGGATRTSGDRGHSVCSVTRRNDCRRSSCLARDISCEKPRRIIPKRKKYSSCRLVTRRSNLKAE